MIKSISGIISKSVILDTDAQTFITAANITNTTQRNAINQLVINLKNNGIWSKCLAIYPFVGGVEASHKFNLKNPLDTNAAFRLVFQTGWTHSSGGAVPNGNTYANTFLVPSASLGLNDKHLSYFSTSSGSTASLMGVDDGGNSDGLVPNFSNAGDNYSSLSAPAALKSGGVSLGFHLITRTSSTNYSYFRNGANKITTTATSSNNSNLSIYIGARNLNGGGSQGTSRGCSFASIGSGLTDTEVTNFYSTVQTFQTSLGR